MRHLKILCSLIIMFFWAPSAFSSSFNEPKNVFELTLQELLNIKVSTGSFLDHTAEQAPAAITIIRRDQIAISGAKNLANLLEQHVPGMMLMTHSEGDKIGLRGLIAAENYKLLLLLNGKNITNMVYEGAILEIDQWDMGDIERVEVIRGPGSVTYGTGAIAGIINIITKTAATAPARLSFTATGVDTYNSRGFNVQYANQADELGVYAFASYRATQGYENPNYYVPNPEQPTDNRYVGKGSLNVTGPQDYLADGNGRPQIKAHIGVNYGDNFSAWLRYTQSGQTRFFIDQRFQLNTLPELSRAINSRTPTARSLAVAADYKYDLSETRLIKSSLTLDSQEYIRWDFSNPQYSPQSYNNVRDYAFSQNRLKGSLLYEYTPDEKSNLVLGYEYTFINVAAPWGKSSDYLLIQEGVHMVNSADKSFYLHDLSLNARPNPAKLEEIGNGLNFETHSHLLEWRYQLSQYNQIFYAHRLDYPDVSKDMFSPRLSLVTGFNETNTLVSTLQRAQRMMPLRAQYLNNKYNNNSAHETLDGLEFSYTNSDVKNTSINLRAFYNDTNAVGYTGNRLEFLTGIELYGVELSATYKLNHSEFTINHSYLDTLSVMMNPALKTGASRNNISYADYYYKTEGGFPVLLTSYGDGLNNWSKNSTKFLFTKKFFNQRLIAHVNAQVFWDYEGSYDEISVYQSAYDSFDVGSLSASDRAAFELQRDQFERERSLLDNSGAFKLDYNLNASVSYLWPMRNSEELQLKVFAENILSSKRRYNVSTGSRFYYPERLSFMPEPSVYGVSLTFNY